MNMKHEYEHKHEVFDIKIVFPYYKCFFILI